MNISIIIPAYNAQTNIEECLGAIIFQSKKYAAEIIVVDDGSTDDTVRIIKQKFKEVKIIQQKNSGPAKARNVGAKDAKGDIILFTDSDCVPHKNWLEEMLLPFEKYDDIVGVKGAYKTKQNELIARFVQIEYEDKYDVMRKYKFIDFIDTYSAAFIKKVFLGVKGYDCRFRVACSEDVDLSFRLANKGYKMVFNPNAFVYHRHPSRLVDYLKKKYKFAYWRILAIKNNPNKLYKDTHTPQTMKLQLIVAPFVLFTFVLSIFANAYLFLEISGFLFLVFLLFCSNFIIKAIRKDFIIGLLSPVYLYLRSFSQLTGILFGFFDIFILRKFD